MLKYVKYACLFSLLISTSALADPQSQAANIQAALQSIPK